MKNKPCVIAVVGPTASGKTALAIELAKQLQTEIISADSRQFYRELPIGSAMPSVDELAQVKHHFIACRSVTEEYAAGSFANDAKKCIHQLLQEKEYVIVCGGSGLYIQALLFGMDEFPEVSDDAKKQVEEIYNNQGIIGWQKTLYLLDVDYYHEVDIHNIARLRRALEVCISSGKPYSSFRTASKEPEFPFIAVGLDIAKPQLHERIHQRVDQMMADGLENEARKVYINRHLKALQTVGYKELFEHFDGKLSYAESIDLIKIHTRQYAKRQLTWFNKQLPVNWVAKENSVDAILQKLH